MRTRMAVLVVLILSLCAGVQSASAVEIRPYMRLGYLLTPPTAEELEFVLVGGTPADAEVGMDMNQINYGIGAQVFFLDNTSIMKNATLRLGAEAGIHRLFSSEHTGAYQSVNRDSEAAFVLLVLGEFKSAEMPFVFQVGLGPALVYWSWEYEYFGYSYEYESDSGIGFCPVIMAAGGLDLQVSDTISIPIMLRSDNVIRYGIMASISGSVGVSIKL